ncbi:hypothetical protein HOLleu_09604 [Holothuria leucospilota]|uniref:Uncharacterized protein n=1 Tax=Holothuria leucospilota TaxID=206669 RepID=A0A9Q1CD24_HOLLE|nr:hypothetical protein HOLleu_09604 [Holothuria leucospilota]
MFALNSFKHDDTGYSPYELFLGRRPLGPGEWADQDPMIGISGGADMNRNYAKRNMLEQHRKNKILYDKKTSAVNIKMGDKVLLKAHPLSNPKKKCVAKLAPKWRGPYRVTSVLTPVNVVISGSGIWKNTAQHSWWSQTCRVGCVHEVSRPV